MLSGANSTQAFSVLVISKWLPTVPEDVDDHLWCYMKTGDTHSDVIPVFPNSRVEAFSRAKSARN